MQYCDDSLKDDLEVVTEAIKNNSFALQYASLRLRADLDLLKFAICLPGWSFDFEYCRASQNFQNAMRVRGVVLKFAG